MIGSPEDTSNGRKEILAGFGKARHLKFCKPLEGAGVKDFARNHCLVEGKRTGHCYDQSLSSSIPIWDWMRSIREGRKPVASFYFPDNLAGPDLLFALKRKGPTQESARDDIVLCVVKVRIQLSLLPTYPPKYENYIYMNKY